MRSFVGTLSDTYISILPYQNLLASVERVCILHTYNKITIKIIL